MHAINYIYVYVCIPKIQMFSSLCVYLFTTIMSIPLTIIFLSLPLTSRLVLYKSRQ